MERIRVKTSNKYDVLVECGILELAGERIKDKIKPCKAAIITDDRVDRLYGETLQTSLETSGFCVVKFAFQNGEKSKNIKTIGKILEFLAKNELTRSDIILALGGGVVGDMAGFAAASYLRGVRFVGVPTTLLAMVDSSVGGKTGFNLDEGKNLVGAFYQPSVVLCDPVTLKTLPKEILSEGRAEAIKTGVIGSEALFNRFIKEPDFDEYEAIIKDCVKIKAGLVKRDERDNGARQLLNFGHTVGHTIEKASGFNISHGSAVAIGMLAEARAARSRSLCDDITVERIKDALVANGLPVLCEYGEEELIKTALLDKKRKGDGITVVIPKKIGKCELLKIGVNELEDYFKAALC